MIEKTTWFQLQPLYRYVRQQAENQKFLKYLEIGSTFSLIAIFLFSAIAPTASAISSLVGEIKSKELTTKNMKQKINNILLAQQDYSAVQEKYQILESSYPTSQEFYNSASAFSSISKETSSYIKQLKFNLSDETNPNKGDPLSFGVNLSTEGSYSSILDAIKKISNGRRLININSIQITQSAVDGNKVLNPTNISLSLSTNLFYLPINSDEKN